MSGEDTDTNTDNTDIDRDVVHNTVLHTRKILRERQR